MKKNIKTGLRSFKLKEIQEGLPEDSAATVNNLSLTSNGLPGCLPNCKNEDLTGANLSGVDLSNVDFSGANLRYANLTEANLFGANLSGADLSSAN